MEKTKSNIKFKVDMTGEEEAWKKKTKYRVGLKRLANEAAKKMRAATHP